MSKVISRPHVAELIERKRIRSRIEAAVARLIDALDAIDGDADMEPSLGAPEINATCRATCCAPDGRWFSARNGQEGWGSGASDDREEDDDGREPAESLLWGGLADV